MLKKSLLLSSLLLFGTQAYSDQYFIGAKAGSTWTKDKFSCSYGSSGSDNTSAFVMDFKGGKIIDDTHRLSLGYSPIFHSGAKIHRVLASYDYLIPMEDRSKLYAGAHFGSVSLRSDDTDFNTTDIAYGVQAGYIKELQENIDLEFGAKYTKYNISKSYNDSIGQCNLKLENDFTLLVGLNYRF